MNMKGEDILVLLKMLLKPGKGGSAVKEEEEEEEEEMKNCKGTVKLQTFWRNV
jgi:hypothetical protein